MQNKKKNTTLAPFAVYVHNQTREVCKLFSANNKNVWYWVNGVPTVMNTRAFKENHSQVE